MRGELDEGIERMRSAMAAWQATGMLLGPDSLGILLADAYLEVVRQQPEGKDLPADDGRAGLLTEGLARIDVVLAPDSVCGQCYQAELYRMRGELLLARDGLAAAGEALACFERAMACGREKGALAWELRAAMSIVRLRQRHHGPRSEAEWEGQGYAQKLAEARACLHTIYGRFTEGFAFPDLQEAAVLMSDTE